ncbi:MAG: heavy metal-associated domain-containing protein [Candidatus Sericytochromatia bacterium]
MKKASLVLGILILFSSNAFSCPESNNGKISFHNHHKVNFSGAKHSSSSFFKSESVFKVKGMTCHSCVKKVETAIKSIKGVKTVKVDLKSAQAKVVFFKNTNENLVNEKIIKSLEKSGFKSNKV